MMKGLLNPIFIALSAIVLLSSCLAKKLEEQESATNRAKAHLLETERMLEQEKEANKQLQTDIDALKKQLLVLEKDTTAKGIELRQKKASLQSLQNENDLVKNQLDAIATASGKDKAILNQALREKEQALLVREEALNKKSREIATLKADLDARMARVNELESTIAEKDAKAQALKEKISKALKGFSSAELNVESRNGRVYVSMSDKLLFKSGSTQVQSAGKEAINQLAQVIIQQPDLTITVEGHTDSIPFKSNAGLIKSNWELSVLRATNITKILVEENGISGERIISSGRGEFMPVASNSTPEGRAKNRRSEIIITPNIEQILDILD